jgi:hypothetical protein
MATKYKIHPAIGIARMGDHPDRFTIGPEVPDGPSVEFAEFVAGKEKAVSFYKADHMIKRQGARFRIYEYKDEGGTMQHVREVKLTEKDVAQITWQVHLTNRKAAGSKILNEKGDRNQGIARERLIVDAGEQSIEGGSQGPVRMQGKFQAKLVKAVAVPLGDLRTDDNGRLIVLGGFGKSFSTADPPEFQGTFNNDNWCDDSSDGLVTATIQFKKGRGSVRVDDPAWVIVGPPDFAPPLGNIVSLYDIVYDAAHTLFQVHYDPELAAGSPSFARHVYPILRRVVELFWVELSASGHAPGAPGYFFDPVQFKLLKDNNADPTSPARQRREAILKRVRKPDGTGGNMPRLKPELDTNRQPRLTAVQYDVLEHWARGQFDNTWQGGPLPGPPLVPLAKRKITEQPFALDKAALDACVGASFYPGIEAPRILRDHAEDIFSAPFRVRPSLPPGTITEGLAIPWQTDFGACGQGWWPAQRPNKVMRNGKRKDWDEGLHDWIHNWSKLGFIKVTGGDPPFAEDERDV